jgi:hypothetical protein
METVKTINYQNLLSKPTMNHYKYNSNINHKPTLHTAKVFRHAGNTSVFKKNHKQKKITNNSKSAFNFVNLIFVSAGIFSVISLGLIFAPNIMTSKIAKAQIVKSQPVTIVTNFNIQEYKSTSKGKSFFQPVQLSENKK